MALGFALFWEGCSAALILTTRPVQLMSDTAAAIRAAKEVQADTLAPDLYRQSNEWFFRAKREYKFKNFDLAKQYAEKARNYAEQAEFESVRNGGNRTEAGGVDPLSNIPDASGGGNTTEDSGAKRDTASVPAAFPTPQGTPAEEFDQRKKEEDDAKKKAEDAAAPAPPASPAPLQPTFFPPGRR